MGKFTAPIAARYLQFVCDETGNGTCLDKLTITGCPIGKTFCFVKTLRKLSNLFSLRLQWYFDYTFYSLPLPDKFHTYVTYNCVATAELCLPG